MAIDLRALNILHVVATLILRARVAALLTTLHPPVMAKESASFMISIDFLAILA